MAAPTYGAAGTAAGGTSTVAPPLPAGLTTGDLILACMAGASGGVATDWSVSAQNGGAWAQLSIGEASVGSSTTMANATIFYDYYNGTQGTPTFNTPGNNGIGRIIRVSGARSSDGPAFAGSAVVTDSSGDVNVSLASGFSTTDADCLIVMVAGYADDNPTFGATWSNANLTGVTRPIHDVTTSGNDSTVDVVYGTLATAGAVGTFTNTAGGTLNSAAVILAIRPPAAAGPQTVTVGLIDQSATTFAPDFDFKFNVGLIDRSGVVFDPSFSQGTSIGLDFLNHAGTTFSPQFNLHTTLPLLSQSGTVFDPQVNQALTLGLISQAGVVFSPQLNLAIRMGLIDQSAVVFAPNFGGDAPAQTVTLGLIDQAGTIFVLQPNLAGQLGILDYSGVVQTPIFIQDQAVLLDLISQIGAVYQPTFDDGAGGGAPARTNTVRMGRHGRKRRQITDA